MLRGGCVILIAWTILTAASPVQAQWNSGFWAGAHRDYKRNVAWPEPFLQPDRAAAVAPFAIMVANGWRRQNLLSDYHFIDDGTRLNLAGETKLLFILTQMPPQRRTVFVQRGLTPDVTAARLDMVQNVGAKMTDDRSVPMVAESNLPNDGWPADDIDAVDRRFRSTRPDPRLSSSSSGSSGSSSGGSGSSGGGNP